MFKNTAHFWNWMARSGIQSTTDSDAAKRIALTNQIAMVFSIALFIFFLFFAFIGKLVALPAMAAFSLIELGWVFMNRMGFYRVTRLGFLITTHIMGLVLCTFAGNKSTIHYGFMVLATLPPLLFNRNERKQMGFALILSIASFATIEQFGSQFTPISDNATTALNFVNYLMFFPITFLAVFYLNEANFQAEEALKSKSQQLEVQRIKSVEASKMAALGEMAGGIAHEINTPLAVIRLLCEQIQEIAEREQFDRTLLKEAATKAEKTTVRIAKIILGLRAFSRDSSSDPFQPVNVVRLIDETLSFCAERFKHSETTITVDQISPDLFFDGRNAQISEVILNLLNNSYDAVADLKEKWIRISAEELGDYVEIRVTDSGSGIAKGVQERIFQPFFTTKEIGKGTGLGLSISKGIVESHGGQLEFDTHSAHTRFVIRLPKKKISAVSTAAPGESSTA